MLSYDSEHLVIQNNTYTELLSFGLLNLISNDKLREQLISLYRNYEVTATHIKEINEFTTLEFSKSVEIGLKYGMPDMYDESYMFVEKEWKYINDPLSPQFKVLENNAVIYNIKYGHFVRYFEDLLSKSKAMITKVEKEINALKK